MEPVFAGRGCCLMDVKASRIGQLIQPGVINGATRHAIPAKPAAGPLKERLRRIGYDIDRIA